MDTSTTWQMHCILMVYAAYMLYAMALVHSAGMLSGYVPFDAINGLAVVASIVAAHGTILATSIYVRE